MAKRGLFIKRGFRDEDKPKGVIEAARALRPWEQIRSRGTSSSGGVCLGQAFGIAHSIVITMIEERIQNIESKVQATLNIPEETKAELLSLLEGLKSEVSALAKTHGEDARSIARFADVSAHEATREQKRPALIQASLSGLTSSVEGLEVEHPRVVQIVNRLATILSNMGI